MIKNKLFSVFIIFFCSLQILNAEDFKYLLNKALESNSNLKSSEIEVELAKEKGSILTRFDNPTIDFNYSSYKLKEKRNKENGQGISVTQKIVPWYVANDKERLSEATIKNEVNKYNLDKQEFIKELSIRYTIYAKSKSFFYVINESHKIATKVYDIILLFSDYGFNKAHAYAYALLGYYLAYLKVNYPNAFYESVLSANTYNINKLKQYFFEMKQLKLKKQKGFPEDTALELGKCLTATDMKRFKAFIQP